MKRLIFFLLPILMLCGCNFMPEGNGAIIEKNLDTQTVEPSNEIIIIDDEVELLEESETQKNESLFKYKYNVLYDTIELIEEQLIVYDKLSKAIEKRETSFNIDNLNSQEFNEVYFAYIWSNPLSALIDFKLTETKNIGNDNTVYFKYKFSAEEHHMIIEEWHNRIETIFEDYIDMNSSDSEIAKQLYIFTASNINYDYSQLEDLQLQDNDLVGTAYYTLIYGKGICNDYAAVYNYLLMQVDIDCMFVVGDGHAWSLVKLDELYYHCDPTWESGYLTGIEDLEVYEPIYFGMSTDMKLNILYAEDVTTKTNIYTNIEVDINELVDVSYHKNYSE